MYQQQEASILAFLRIRRIVIQTRAHPHSFVPFVTDALCHAHSTLGIATTKTETVPCIGGEVASLDPGNLTRRICMLHMHVLPICHTFFSHACFFSLLKMGVRNIFSLCRLLEVVVYGAPPKVSHEVSFAPYVPPNRRFGGQDYREWNETNYGKATIGTSQGGDERGLGIFGIGGAQLSLNLFVREDAV